jgi:hypothetical protein
MSNQKLRYNVKVDGDVRIISFTGNIDEDFNYEELLQNKGKNYKLDLNEIKMINSCGIREWVHFVEKLGSDVKIEYYNCPQIIIQQMNLVSGFLTANAEIKSFYAPYFCEDNDEEKSVLLQSSQIVNFKAPVITTNVDGQEVEMEFDAIEDQFFKFLKR